MSEIRDQLDRMVSGALDDLGADPWEWVGDQLDAWVSVDVRTPGDLSDVRSVTVLVTVGGPHVEVRTFPGGTEAEGWWGTENVRRTLYGPEAERFEAWADEWSEMVVSS